MSSLKLDTYICSCKQINQIMIVETDRLMTLANYAKLIGKSRSWVDKLIKRNELKCIKVDGIKYILR